MHLHYRTAKHRTRVAAPEQVTASTQQVPRVDRGPSPSPEPGGSTKKNNNNWGYAALFGVAVLWGSYTPAIKMLFQIEQPPDAPLLNALQACLSAAFLVAANATAALTHKPVQPHPENSNPLLARDVALREATLKQDAAVNWANNYNSDSDSEDAYYPPSSTAAAAATAPTAPARRQPSNAVERLVARALNWTADKLLLAGGEVGLWMALAFSLEVAGVQLTSATKAAFLNQVSVLITPLLVHLSGEHVRGLEWLACALGLLGSVLVALDSILAGTADVMEAGHGAVAAGQGNEVLGMIYILVSAMFFALSTVRLGRYSAMFDSLKLSTVSTCTLGLFSLGWVAVAIMSRANGATYEMQVIQGMLASPQCVLVLLWVGLGPGALAAFLQATGQKSVPPAQAQVIYSTTPLWAAAAAMLFLNASDEAMGSVAWAGAAVMLFSSLMTAVIPPPQQSGGGGSGGTPATANLGSPSATTTATGVGGSNNGYSHNGYAADDSLYHASRTTYNGNGNGAYNGNGNGVFNGYAQQHQQPLQHHVIPMDGIDQHHLATHYHHQQQQQQYHYGGFSSFNLPNDQHGDVSFIDEEVKERQGLKDIV